MKNNNPYKITQDDWDDPDFESYDKVFVDFDSKTGALTELSGITYDDEERAAIGEENIRSLIDGSEDLIQVRNDRLEIDYEITR
jgi:hypothetical protein